MVRAIPPFPQTARKGWGTQGFVVEHEGGTAHNFSSADGDKIPAMPRGLLRYQQCGVFHFLTFSCHGREPLLARGDGYLKFERVLEEVRVRYGFVVAGYVLMPEHVHLLVNEPQGTSLSKAIQVLKQRSAHVLLARGERRFWLPRYYDFDVWTDAKQIEKLRYIHRNPVRRGLVARPEDWRWSSFRHHATGEVGVVEIESRWTAARREGLRSHPFHDEAVKRMGHPRVGSSTYSAPIPPFSR